MTSESSRKIQHTRHHIGARVAVPLAALALLTGCSPALPPCVVDESSDAGNGKTSTVVASASTKELLIGIDGSGSMLGHVQVADASQWLKLLQSVNLSAQTLGLNAKGYRVGGGEANLIAGSPVQGATEPCFFQGCGPYTPISSSLQTLWTIPVPTKGTPLRVLISDLEVNQSDISALISGIRQDLAKGASAGILALKLPFEGQVFNPQGQPLIAGKLNRPVYLLATGEATQVRQLLEEVRKTMALKGVSSQELSMLDAEAEVNTLTAKSALPVPGSMGDIGLPLRLNNQQFSPTNNPHYQFIKLKPGATGILLASVKPWSGGTTRPNLGLVNVERIPLGGGSTSTGGIQLKTMTVAGSNLRMELAIPASATSGAIRATVAAGSMPEQWWLEWDRDDAKAKNAGEKTEGLLLLLTTLGQQVRGGSSSRAPAAAFCVAFQR